MPSISNASYVLAIGICGTISVVFLLFTAFSIALFSKTDRAARARAFVSKKLARRNPNAAQMSFAARLVTDNSNAATSSNPNKPAPLSLKGDTPLAKAVDSITPQRHDLAFTLTGSNSSEWMLLCLFFANFLQLFASQVGYNWLYLDIKAPESFNLCVLQSLGWAIADLSSAIWATFLCYGTIIKVFGGNTAWLNHRTTKIILITFGYMFPTFMTFLPYAYTEGNPLYNKKLWGASGTGKAWCFWMSPEVRVYNHYLWIIICIGLNMVGYAFMIGNLWYMQRKGGAGQEARNVNLRKTIKKLIAYPVAFTVLYLPICINRITALYSVPHPAFTVTAVVLMMCDGFVTTSLFIWRRQIIERYLALFGLLDWAAFKNAVSAGSTKKASIISKKRDPSLHQASGHSSSSGTGEV